MELVSRRTLYGCLYYTTNTKLINIIKELGAGKQSKKSKFCDQFNDRIESVFAVLSVKNEFVKYINITTGVSSLESDDQYLIVGDPNSPYWSDMQETYEGYCSVYVIFNRIKYIQDLISSGINLDELKNKVSVKISDMINEKYICYDE